MPKMFSAHGTQSPLDYVLQSLVEVDLIEYGVIAQDENNTVQVGFYGDNFIGVMLVSKEGVQRMTLLSKNSAPALYEAISSEIKSSDSKVYFSVEETDNDTVIITGKPVLNN